MKKFFKALIIIALIMVLGGVYLLTRRTPQNQQETQTVVVDVNQQLQQVLTKVEAFYMDPKEKSFLKSESIDPKLIETYKDEVNHVNATTAERNRVLREIEIVQWKQKAQDAVNELYNQSEGKVIIADKILETKVLAAGLTQEKMAQLKKEILENIPQRLLEPGQTPGEDAFNQLITKLIEDASTQIDHFTTAKDAMDRLLKIKIEDGQIGNIAKAMREFEQAQTKVADSKLKEELKKLEDAYLVKFKAEFTLIAQEIPGYYEIAKVALEPSKLLSKFFEDNKMAFFGEADSESNSEATEVAEDENANQQVVPIQNVPVTTAVNNIVTNSELEVIEETMPQPELNDPEPAPEVTEPPAISESSNQ